MTGPLAEALHAEWTKARTMRGTGWLLLAAVVLTVAVGAAVVAGVLAISSEYGAVAVLASATGLGACPSARGQAPACSRPGPPLLSWPVGSVFRLRDG